MPSRTRPELAVLVVLAIVGAAVFAFLSTGESGQPPRGAGATWRGVVDQGHPSVAIEQRQIVVLRTPSVAQRLERVHYATEEDQRRWTAQADAAQEQVLAVLAAHRLGVRPDYRFARVLNGFSAVLDARAVSVLESVPEVAGIYPVRAAFPAALSAEALTAPATLGSGLGLPGYEGRGLTVALLDTGVDRQQEYIRGRVEQGIDIVGGTESAEAQSNPQDSTVRERHGTQLAGLLVGSGGPGELHGIAPAATVLPIRVAGWQPDAEGRMVVYARTDQLIAGLERAVDPDGDGDTHDAARVALIGLAAPFAAFADSPEARAISGALALDTLVVVPAGNDGVAGPRYGSLSGPGGAEDAITVGAIDERAETPSVHVVLRRGLEIVFDGDVPLLGSAGPARSGELAVGVPRGGGARPADFLDRRGLSLVAGRAALVRTGGNPTDTAIAAAGAGAAAVVLYGVGLPPGSLGLSSEIGIPVLVVPAAPARALLDARGRGLDVGISLGSVREEANERGGRVASFSSRGLSFGGLVKPDLTAPGVALPTSEPGAAKGAKPSYATVNGTSAAAAVVAASAAVLAQARPGLGARELASLLVGYARPPRGGVLTAAGVGNLDLGASAAAELVATTRSIGFGPGAGRGWRATRTFTIRNVSSRRLVIDVEAFQEQELLSLEVEPRPRQLVLRAGRQAPITLTVRSTAAPTEPAATGIVAVRVLGGQTLRVPWAITFPDRSQTLLPDAELDRTTFSPSDASPAVLNVRAGAVVDDDGTQILPASRLDILLYTRSGRFMGVLARLRDLLPGSYTFGITGRSPIGLELRPGAYELRLVAWPVLGDAQSRVRVPFQISEHAVG
jgi:hypothetical protein